MPYIQWNTLYVYSIPTLHALTIHCFSFNPNCESGEACWDCGTTGSQRAQDCSRVRQWYCYVILSGSPLLVDVVEYSSRNMSDLINIPCVKYILRIGVSLEPMKLPIKAFETLCYRNCQWCCSFHMLIQNSEPRSAVTTCKGNVHLFPLCVVNVLCTL